MGVLPLPMEVCPEGYRTYLETNRVYIIAWSRLLRRGETAAIGPY